MYNTIFSYNGSADGEAVVLNFIPDFFQEVACSKDWGENVVFSSDKNVIMHNEYVYAEEDAQWFCIKDKYFLHFYVTGKTKNIITGEEKFDTEINQLLKEARGKYKLQRQEEIRIYLYDACNGNLKQPIGCDTYGYGLYKYDLQRKEVRKQFIDRFYSKPEYDCYILGRVVKTTGDRDGDLVDFIEPVAIIPFEIQFESISDYREYVFKRTRLYYCITELQRFCIKKFYSSDGLEARRIKAYLKTNNIRGSYPEAFCNRIQEAFAKGDCQELLKLNNVLHTPQDCKRVCFEVIITKEGNTFKGDDKVSVRYDNREIKWEKACDIYENRDYCRNATILCLGTSKKVYQFNMF